MSDLTLDDIKRVKFPPAKAAGGMCVGLATAGEHSLQQIVNQPINIHLPENAEITIRTSYGSPIRIFTKTPESEQLSTEEARELYPELDKGEAYYDEQFYSEVAKAFPSTTAVEDFIKKNWPHETPPEKLNLLEEQQLFGAQPNPKGKLQLFDGKEKKLMKFEHFQAVDIRLTDIINSLAKEDPVNEGKYRAVVSLRHQFRSLVAADGWDFEVGPLD